MNNHNKMVAFVLAQNYAPREIYIDLIAANKGYGHKILNQIKKNVNYINLNSVPQAAGFYEKQNFKRLHPGSLRFSWSR
jgi:hypothetical protein